jgi:hypothetical protein
MGLTKDFLKFMYAKKEPALLGGLVGFALFGYMKYYKGVSFMAVQSRTGLIDTIWSKTSAVVLADWKVALTCVLIGVFVGVVADMLLSYFKIGRR